MVPRSLTIVFMGTPDFAVPTLRCLLEWSRCSVIGVISQPDRPQGRGLKLKQTPVKECALSHSVPVLQPEKLRNDEVKSWLRGLSPDCIVVTAYGKILPGWILDLPPMGCINVHASLLPRYRGAAPIQWAIINGETVTGITTMLMNRGMDTGDILLQREYTIAEEDTAGSLHDSLSLVGGELLIETLHGRLEGSITPSPQNHELATNAPLLTRELSALSWNQPATQIVNLIRGLDPWPGATTWFQSQSLRVRQARVEKDPVPIGTTPGQILHVDREQGILVAAREGAVRIRRVQPESKKEMSVHDFINGYHIDAGDRFCEPPGR